MANKCTSGFALDDICGKWMEWVGSCRPITDIESKYNLQHSEKLATLL